MDKILETLSAITKWFPSTNVEAELRVTEIFKFFFNINTWIKDNIGLIWDYLIWGAKYAGQFLLWLFEFLSGFIRWALSLLP